MKINTDLILLLLSMMQPSPDSITYLSYAVLRTVVFAAMGYVIRCFLQGLMCIVS